MCYKLKKLSSPVPTYRRQPQCLAFPIKGETFHKDFQPDGTCQAEDTCANGQHSLLELTSYWQQYCNGYRPSFWLTYHQVF